MSMTLTQDAFSDMLEHYLAAESTITCRLFMNAHTPADTDNALSYSEATFTGYSAVVTSSWSAPPVANPSTTTAATCVYTSSADQSPQTVYGAYLTDLDGNVIGAELFSSPVVIQFNGDSISVTATLSMSQC